MSFNQSRAERSDSSQYRRPGRSGSSAQPKNFSGGSGKGGGGGGGGGPAPPPSINSSLSSNRSYKKSNNAQGGQSRGSGAVVNTDSNYASAVRTLQNGAHLQPSAHGAADAPVGVSVKPTADMSTQKSPQAVPKAPSSQPSTVNSDSTAPTTPAKASGEASNSFRLQFGSISPGFMNGMQIRAPTTSAPQNLDEQQRDQAGKFGVQRKPVKITDPRTHKELRLVSSGPRSNANVPQSQPITSVSPAHPITYYANSYNPNSLYFPAPSSVSLTGTQINPSSQVPRFSYPISQSTPTLPVVNPSTHNSYSGQSSAPSASVQIFVRQATGSHVAKIADSSQVVSSTSIERVESPTIVQQPREASSNDKPVLELGTSKSNMARGKKKMKEILQKADAAGTTSDLYMAYMGPEERKEAFASSESITGTSSMNLKQVLVDAAQNDVEKARQSIPEPDDWELLKSLLQSWTLD